MTSVSIELHIESTVDGPECVSSGLLYGLVRHVLDLEAGGGEWNIGIRFTSDEDIQKMHRDFMGIDTPTDIMTFPHGDDGDGFPNGAGRETGGDLVISVDRARENASTAGWSTVDELLFLIVHGMLHLLDWSDDSDAERDVMLARQHELLREWDRLSPHP